MFEINTPEKIGKMIAEQTEKSILFQLNDFVSRGLIVVESGPISFFQDRSVAGQELKIHQTVTLRLKDKEYIEKLEAENTDLKVRLKSIHEACNGIMAR